MTTNQYKAINFLNQTGDFDYNLSISINNYLGYFDFGLSGNKKIEFKGQYGKIKDSNDNIIIGYQPNVQLNIRGYIHSGKESLYIQDNLIYSNIDNTGYNFNYFYLNPQNCTLDYNFSLTGQATDFTTVTTTRKIKDLNITGSNGIPFSTQFLTGVIVNQNPGVEIKIFSGQALTKSSSYSLSGFPISFYDSGFFYINSNTGFDSIVVDEFEGLFYTNFGNIQKTISITGELIPLFFLYMDIYPTISGFPNVNTGYEQIFVNVPNDYSVSYGFVSGASIQASISYVSGLTGYITGFLTGTGNFTGTLSGLITGSGYLQTFVDSGINFSGENTFLNDVQFTKDSGFYAEQFFVATGFSQSNYVITGYGLGSGYVYENVFATGFLTNLPVTGNVPYVGGAFVPVNISPFAGTGLAVDQNNSGFLLTGIVYEFLPVTAQLLYTGLLTGVILNSSQYSGKNFIIDPPKDSTIVYSQPYTILATGYESGIIIESGVVDPEFFINISPGYYTFVKNFSGISGSSRTVDQEDVITGFLSLLQGTVSEKRKYLATVNNLSGSVTGSMFLSSCDANSQIPTGFVVSADVTTGVSLYVVTGDCDTKSNIIDEDVPKFIVIRPTGTFELTTKTIETGYNKPLNTDSFYFNQDSGVRTHIFGPGSGYFSNVIGGSTNSGIWQHIFDANELNVTSNLSNYFVNNLTLNFTTLEDDGNDYFSELNFTVTGNYENINLKLEENNIPINVAPSRDIYYRLILSKKIKDGYSGFYESDFTNISQTIQYCTGLYQGDYKIRLKYTNNSTGPIKKNICRIPIQVCNILDKNYYNKSNVSIFTGELVYYFDNYRYIGGGWNYQSNIFYTETGIYGSEFLNYTGITSTYSGQLFTPMSSGSEINFTPNNVMYEAIKKSVDNLVWKSTGLKIINLFTNYPILSGLKKNDFLSYIGNVNANSGIIFNTFNSNTANLTIDNPYYSSYDNASEFLKDIASFGGGTYYSYQDATDIVDGYIGYDNFLPLNSGNKMYMVCNNVYPASPGTDTRPGYDGINNPPGNSAAPVYPPINVTGNLPSSGIPINMPTGSYQSIPSGTTFRIGGGPITPSPGPGPSPGPSTSLCEPRNKDLKLTLTNWTWEKDPTYSPTSSSCKCTKEGTLKIKFTVANPNCISKEARVSAVYKLYDMGTLVRTYEGAAQISMAGAPRAGVSIKDGEIIIKACGPANSPSSPPQQKGILNLSLGRSNEIRQDYSSTNQCTCNCPHLSNKPSSPYDLKLCPDKKDQEIVYAWDCYSKFEAEDQSSAIAHNIKMKRQNPGVLQTPPWLFNECPKCKNNCNGLYIGTNVIQYSEATKNSSPIGVYEKGGKCCVKWTWPDQTAGAVGSSLNPIVYIGNLNEDFEFVGYINGGADDSMTLNGATIDPQPQSAGDLIVNYPVFLGSKGQTAKIAIVEACCASSNGGGYFEACFTKYAKGEGSSEYKDTLIQNYGYQ